MKEVVIRMRGEDAGEILLYGQIGASMWSDDGIDAKSFREQVKACKSKVLNLRVNSPGGSVFDADAMVSALDEYKKRGRLEVDIDGVAASAASYIACCGDVVRLAANGKIMIHNPNTMIAGDSGEMRRMADLLDATKEQMLTMYQRLTKKLTREQIAAAMDAETWYVGQQAVAAGLAHSCGAEVQVAAFAGMKEMLAKFGYRHVPELPSDAEAWAATNERRAMMALLVKG